MSANSVYDPPADAPDATVRQVAWLDAGHRPTDDPDQVATVHIEWRRDDGTPVLTGFGPPSEGECTALALPGEYLASFPVR